MLSRIADSLYWLDRYMERTAGILLILRTEYVLALDKGTEEPHSWQPVLEHFSPGAPAVLEACRHHTQETLRHIITDMSNGNSLRTLLTRARENARGAQDQITKEVWEEVNRIYHTVHAPGFEEQLRKSDALELLDRMTEMTTLYRGVASGTMPRGMGWGFMNIGRHTERCLLTLDLADRYLGQIGYDLDDARDILFWRQLLLSLSGYELHLKTYRSPRHTRNVADQLLFNRQFTHSVRYTMDKISHYLADVTEGNDPEVKERILREFGRMHSRVRYADLDQVEAVGPQAFLAGLREGLYGFTRSLSHSFFSYA
jgi:uncharacterized alpha-E superfamily protein